MEPIFKLFQDFWTNLQHGQLPELGPWNYVLLSLFIIWQGPIATLLGGAAASAGLMKPALVFLAGVTGNLTADIIWYSLGRRGNVERLFESGRFTVHRPRFQRLQVNMQKHATKILLLAKLSAGFAVPALLTAGVTKLRWRRWFPVVFIGETIWTGTLVLIGYYATEALKRAERGIELFLMGTAILFVVLVVWYIPRMLRETKSLQVSPEEENKQS